MKVARREANKLERGEAKPDDVVDVPPSVQALLRDWRAVSLTTLAIPKRTPKAKKVLTLFSDASEKGWGALVVDDGGSVIGSYGQRWTAKEATRHINVLEAEALLLAVEKFAPSMADVKELVVRVDNTSVMFSTAKGSSRSEDLVPWIAKVSAALKKPDVPVTIGYVKSAENPADGLSRGAAGPGPVSAAAFAGRTRPLRNTRRVEV
jgi:hypothetical protein